ncbi:RiPP maturation radical SAM C-methyltransferase [Paractinoplanes ferrugineus]|uniref:RiPP maturation radical SAM protein 1 n=1 Tax=Paractinoplanes ferrugineus TaxID=113564 RepID=A0A919J812_9ACTN|nr:RiPP maturation radical SAM C-methyltransferase [Actinoplanes ferrugineus]GIE15284.1 RiPP maturation radical SAM protein 1 [Actinoplanes ferrugineus]
MILPDPRPVPREPSAAERAAWPVVLVSMPFMTAERPSIQLGLLKAIAEAHGWDVRTLHANLDLAHRIGAEAYRTLCEQRGQMFGDWLFSVAAFGEQAPDPDGRLLDDHAAELDLPADLLRRIRDEDVPGYLDDLVGAVSWKDVRVVGFSCTFQQNAASFALARRLKREFPHLVTVFGGANFDDEMGLEYVRRVDAIDYAVLGEGDVAFPELLSALATGADPGSVPGVAGRRGDEVVATPSAPPFERLDESPPPDYDEYFSRAEGLGLQPSAGQRTVRIPFESARGCWWGAKHHCTFCGLNGSSMRFRAKSPGRVAVELATQARRYRSFRFEAVDNILDTAYLSGLFPELIAAGTTYDIFYEVKANLTREQLRLLRQGGVTHLQPGLESLSTRVLGLMRKGVRAGQNVNVLRWGQYYGITISWNIIWGFPGESADDYRAQAAVLPHLVHLRPPAGAGRVWLERFSPLYTDKTAGVRERRPERGYRYVYPDRFDLGKIAYFFEYELADPLPDEAYAGVRAGVEAWKAAWQRATPPTLTYFSAPGLLQIYDGRHPGAEGTYTFEGDLAEIYLACVDRPISASAVRERLSRRLPLDAVEEAFAGFAERGLMFLDGSAALALALPAGATR